MTGSEHHHTHQPIAGWLKHVRAQARTVAHVRHLHIRRSFTCRQKMLKSASSVGSSTSGSGGRKQCGLMRLFRLCGSRSCERLADGAGHSAPVPFDDDIDNENGNGNNAIASTQQDNKPSGAGVYERRERSSGDSGSGGGGGDSGRRRTPTQTNTHDTSPSSSSVSTSEVTECSDLTDNEVMDDTIMQETVKRFQFQETAIHGSPLPLPDRKIVSEPTPVRVRFHYIPAHPRTPGAPTRGGGWDSGAGVGLDTLQWSLPVFAKCAKGDTGGDEKGSGGPSEEESHSDDERTTESGSEVGEVDLHLTEALLIDSILLYLDQQQDAAGGAHAHVAGPQDGACVGFGVGEREGGGK